MAEAKLPVWALAGLGATQIIGYGTLYYCISILVPDMARDLAMSQQWVFGCFSAALLIGALAAPMSGSLSDRWGAGHVMTVGSVGAAVSLALLALSQGVVAFAASLVLTQVVSAGVLYSTAFTAIVQAGGRKAQTSIVHLTLIAGFASSIFWPVTTWLHGVISWREVLFLYAGMHLVVCLPVHVALARLTSGAVIVARAVSPGDDISDSGPSAGKLVLALMMLGFAVEGYALSAMLVHMVSLMQALGLGSAGLLVASLFGPSQVASRLVNLVFGGRLSQAWLAVIAACLLPVGLTTLLVTSPWFPGAFVFAICMGLGSGLTSIVAGTLPLELFGRRGYGKLLGWSTTAKQIISAVAPFLMSASMSTISVVPSLWVVVATGIVGLSAFVAIPLVLGLPEAGAARDQSPSRT